MIIDPSERAVIVDRIRQRLDERPEIVFACLHVAGLYRIYSAAAFFTVTSNLH